MKRIITNYTYFRLFLFLSVVYVVIFMLFTLFITNQISSYSFREMNSFLQDKLSHTAENTDFVFFNLKNYGLRMYEDRDIGGWLFADKKDPLLEAYASNTAARYIRDFRGPTHSGGPFRYPLKTGHFSEFFKVESLMGERWTHKESREGIMPVPAFFGRNLRNQI